MKDQLAELSWWLLVPLAIGAGLAPWPAGPEPHLVEKLRWLAAGELTRPLDIFDLVFHATPALLAVAKGVVEVRSRGADGDDGQPPNDGHARTDPDTRHSE